MSSCLLKIDFLAKMYNIVYTLKLLEFRLSHLQTSPLEQELDHLKLLPESLQEGMTGKDR